MRTRALVFRCLSNSPSDIARWLMDAARNFSKRCIGAAARFQWTSRAVFCTRAINNRVGFCNNGAWIFKWTPSAAQCIPAGQRYSSAAASHWKSSRSKVPSLRSVLSNTGTCGSIFFLRPSNPASTPFRKRYRQLIAEALNRSAPPRDQPSLSLTQLRRCGVQALLQHQ